jgi:uncharacterized protein (TIGR03437 family)
VNCGIPPGIGRGRTMVRVRTRDSRFSNAVPVLIDPTPEDTAAIAEAAALEVTIVADGRDWRRNQVRLGRDAVVSLWVRGIPEVAARKRVNVTIGGRALQVVFLSAADDDGVRQVNALVPGDLKPGDDELVVRYGEIVSAPARIRAVTE